MRLLNVTMRVRVPHGPPFMNIDQNIIDKWPCHEFRGKPFKSRHGFTYVEALHKSTDTTYFYVVEADSFVCRDSLKIGAPELIFNNIVPSLS